jgi:hypothetical protein
MMMMRRYAAHNRGLAQASSPLLLLMGRVIVPLDGIAFSSSAFSSCAKSGHTVIFKVEHTSSVSRLLSHTTRGGSVHSS